MPLQIAGEMENNNIKIKDGTNSRALIITIFAPSFPLTNSQYPRFVEIPIYKRKDVRYQWYLIKVGQYWVPSSTTALPALELAGRPWNTIVSVRLRDADLSTIWSAWLSGCHLHSHSHSLLTAGVSQFLSPSWLRTPALNKRRGILCCTRMARNATPRRCDS